MGELFVDVLVLDIGREMLSGMYGVLLAQRLPVRTEDDRESAGCTCPDLLPTPSRLEYSWGFCHATNLILS